MVKVVKPDRDVLSRVTQVTGVYATSDQLQQGHVGINKVNPVLAKIRNLERSAATMIQMYWKQKNRKGQWIDPVLVVKQKSKVEPKPKSLKRTTTTTTTTQQRIIKKPVPIKVGTEKVKSNLGGANYKDGRVMLRDGQDIDENSPFKILRTVGAYMLGNRSGFQNKPSEPTIV
jgi:hypothetical protein